MKVKSFTAFDNSSPLTYYEFERRELIANARTGST